MKKTFEHTLPDGYVEVYHIDASHTLAAILLTAGSFALFGITLIITFGILGFDARNIVLDWKYLWIFLGMSIGYTILHELTHGAVYYCATNQRLTFGLKWNCAYCGVPQVYTYRSTTIASLLAPLVIYSIIFIYGMVFSRDPMLTYLLALVFSVHISGCIGDIYLALLLGLRYTGKEVLTRDSGPRQWIYMKAMQ